MYPKKLHQHHNMHIQALRSPKLQLNYSRKEKEKVISLGAN